MKEFPHFLVQAQELSISFDGLRSVFPQTGFTMTNRECLGITGMNGSGKSTLMKLLAGILTPSTGSIALQINHQSIEKELIPMQIGLIAPYLSIYEEFTPKEHAIMFCNLSDIRFDNEYYEHIIELCGISNYQHQCIKTFSSGMKQRVKYMLALMRKPILLLLDEPSTNFDSKGHELFRTVVQKQREQGGGTIIATNEQAETQFCDRIISLS